MEGIGPDLNADMKRVMEMYVKHKGSLLAGFAILLFLAAPAACAFEISGTYTEEGQKWLDDHWGENITIGDLHRIAYDSETVKEIEANVDPVLLKRIRSRPYYWGDRYPPEEVIPGWKINDDEFGVIFDTDGRISDAILGGADDETITALMEENLMEKGINPESEPKPLRSGISVSADQVTCSGGLIWHSGSG